MSEKCLNCNATTENNFCSVCGQKTSTHRFSLKHFLLHDFIHGVFHLDKGFFFTIKELFTRPGHSIREYVQGKRVKHFNAFTAIIIIMGIGYFIGEFTKDNTINLSKSEKDFEGFYKVAKHYAKLIALSWVPFYAFVSYLLFKKSKQNYSENLVLNMYMIVGILIIESVFSISILPYTSGIVLKVAVALITVLKMCYYFWFYYQYFSTNYNKGELLIRSVVMVFIIIFITKIIAQIVNKIGLLYFH